MKQILNVISIFLFLIIQSCNNEKKIEMLLNSSEKNDLISGALKAGKSGDKKFVHLLLKNADDPRRSINLKHKGLTVYQAKMEALRKIFNEDPPVKIDTRPDSAVINFYIMLAKNNNL